MPIVRAESKLIFYAHVPKCGGSTVQDFLRGRFGQIAFEDRRHNMHPVTQRWSKTSPQHIDRASLSRLFPDGFFDSSFTIVRHPVSRVISCYHFQMEVEQTISKLTSFNDWLLDLAEGFEEDPFQFDNHVRPMDEIVPPGAKVFHLEHSLDGLVPYFDEVTGNKDGPRLIGHANKRGEFAKASSGKVEPTKQDLDLISSIYGKDFDRFGYVLDRKEPLADKPHIPAEYAAERDALRQSNTGFGFDMVKSALKRLR
jgi:hypothetical protein